MDRNQARRLFEAKRRFPAVAGRVIVREVELAAVIAAVKAERRSPSPHGSPGTRAQTHLG